jgi:hypothetical protein
MRLTSVDPSAALLALGSALLFGASVMPQPAGANMMEQIITSKCAEAMQADFKKAGKTPPAGMVEEACSCVADGMLKKRQSLEQAKSLCVEQATVKYGQP